jgi:hypothetical protein
VSTIIKWLDCELWRYYRSANPNATPAQIRALCAAQRERERVDLAAARAKEVTR